MPNEPPERPAAADPERPGAAEACAVCGSDALVWRKCKQLCMRCGSINRSCADL